MRKLFAVLALCLLANVCLGQKTIEELADLPKKKFFKDVYYDSDFGRSLVKLLNKKRIRFEDLPELKKVGLLSVFIRDDSYRKGRRGGVTYNHDSEENKFASGILEMSIGEIQQSLAKLDMELITSDVYLDTEEKKRQYRVFNFNYSMIPEAKSFGEFFIRNEKAKGSPQGYKPIYATFNNGEDESIVNPVGTLATGLELDALMTIEILTRTTGKSILLESITVVIHSAHPTLPEEGLHVGVGQYAPFRQVAFAEIVDGEIKRERYDGFATILSRLVTGLAEIAREEILSIE